MKGILPPNYLDMQPSGNSAYVCTSEIFKKFICAQVLLYKEMTSMSFYVNNLTRIFFRVIFLDIVGYYCSAYLFNYMFG